MAAEAEAHRAQLRRTVLAMSFSYSVTFNAGSFAPTPVPGNLPSGRPLVPEVRTPTPPSVFTSDTMLSVISGIVQQAVGEPSRRITRAAASLIAEPLLRRISEHPNLPEEAPVVASDNDDQPELPPLPIAVNGVSAPLTAYMHRIVSHLCFVADGSRCTARRRYINATDVFNAFQQDEQLQQIAKKLQLEEAVGLVAPEHLQLQRHFPRWQQALDALHERYNLWHNPAAIPLLIKRFCTGDLQAGDLRYWRTLHLRPVQFYGLRRFDGHNAFWEQPLENVASIEDEEEPDEDESDGRPRNFPWDGDDDMDESGSISMGFATLSASDQALWNFAFDLVDADGREFPLRVEFRSDHPSGRFYSLAGAVYERRTNRLVATALSSDQWRGDLVPHEDDFAEVFASYRAHGWSSEQWEEEFDDALGHTRPTTQVVTEPAKTPPEVVKQYELEALLSTMCKLSAFNYDELSIFTATVPSATRRRFTIGVLRQITGSPPAASSDSASAMSDDDTLATSSSSPTSSFASLPDDVLGVIAEYRPIELPFYRSCLPNDNLACSSSGSRPKLPRRSMLSMNLHRSRQQRRRSWSPRQRVGKRSGVKSRNYGRGRSNFSSRLSSQTGALLEKSWRVKLRQPSPR